MGLGLGLLLVLVLGVSSFSLRDSFSVLLHAQHYTPCQRLSVP